MWHEAKKVCQLHPTLLRKRSFGWHTSNLLGGVHVFNVTGSLTVDEIKQPLKMNSVGSGNVSQVRARAFDDHSFVVFENIKEMLACLKSARSMSQNRNRQMNPIVYLVSWGCIVLDIAACLPEQMVLARQWLCPTNSMRGSLQGRLLWVNAVGAFPRLLFLSFRKKKSKRKEKDIFLQNERKKQDKEETMSKTFGNCKRKNCYLQLNCYLHYLHYLIFVR